MRSQKIFTGQNSLDWAEKFVGDLQSSTFRLPDDRKLKPKIVVQKDRVTVTWNHPNYKHSRKPIRPGYCCYPMKIVG